MRITAVDCHVLVQPAGGADAAVPAHDTLVVEVQTDEGLSGFGECDINPWVARAVVEGPAFSRPEFGLRDLFVGADPADVEALWDLVHTTAPGAARGRVVVSALGAIDLALHDLRAQVVDRPCHELLGGPVRHRIPVYAALQPEASSLEDYRDRLVDAARDAVDQGFGALRVGVVFTEPGGGRPAWGRAADLLAAVRAAVGPYVTLLADAQYGFPDADTALDVLPDWADAAPSLVKTPLPPTDLDGHRALADGQPLPIAAGEWLTERDAHLRLMDTGRVKILQPDIGRVGGLTPMARLAAMAGERGVRMAPHTWKTGISLAAAAHLAAVTPHCDLLGLALHTDREGSLSACLTPGAVQLIDGCLPVPTGPGLGVEIDRDALRSLGGEARRIGEAWHMLAG